MVHEATPRCIRASYHDKIWELIHWTTRTALRLWPQSSRRSAKSAKGSAVLKEFRHFLASFAALSPWPQCVRRDDALVAGVYSATQRLQ